jgi:hypothetical protein
MHKDLIPAILSHGSYTIKTSTAKKLGDGDIQKGLEIFSEQYHRQNPDGRLFVEDDLHEYFDEETGKVIK